MTPELLERIASAIERIAAALEKPQLGPTRSLARRGAEVNFGRPLSEDEFAQVLSNKLRPPILTGKQMRERWKKSRSQIQEILRTHPFKLDLDDLRRADIREWVDRQVARLESEKQKAKSLNRWHPDNGEEKNG